MFLFHALFVRHFETNPRSSIYFYLYTVINNILILWLPSNLEIAVGLIVTVFVFCMTWPMVLISSSRIIQNTHTIITNNTLFYITNNDPLLYVSFSVENLYCRLTLEAGYQCQCEVNNQIVPLNGTSCISKLWSFKMSTSYSSICS